MVVAELIAKLAQMDQSAFIILVCRHDLDGHNSVIVLDKKLQRIEQDENGYIQLIGDLDQS